jgi:hypothetical protein
MSRVVRYGVQPQQAKNVKTKWLSAHERKIAKTKWLLRAGRAEKCENEMPLGASEQKNVKTKRGLETRPSENRENEMTAVKST